MLEKNYLRRVLLKFMLILLKHYLAMSFSAVSASILHKLALPQFSSIIRKLGSSTCAHRVRLHQLFFTLLQVTLIRYGVPMRLNLHTYQGEIPYSAKFN